KLHLAKRSNGRIGVGEQKCLDRVARSFRIIEGDKNRCIEIYHQNRSCLRASITVLLRLLPRTLSDERNLASEGRRRRSPPSTGPRQATLRPRRVITTDCPRWAAETRSLSFWRACLMLTLFINGPPKVHLKCTFGML